MAFKTRFCHISRLLSWGKDPMAWPDMPARRPKMSFFAFRGPADESLPVF